MTLTKEQILNADDKTIEVVNVPNWGGDVNVSTMTGFARDNFEAGLIGKNGGTNMTNVRARLCAATIVSDDGKLIFTEADVLKLGQKSAASLNLVFDVAQRLNLISHDDVEELAKN